MSLKQQRKSRYTHLVGVAIRCLEIENNLHECLQRVEERPCVAPSVQSNEASCDTIPQDTPRYGVRVLCENDFDKGGLEVGLLRFEMLLHAVSARGWTQDATRTIPASLMLFS